MNTYKLKEIGEILTGGTPSKKNEAYYDSKDVLFIKPGDLCLNSISLINNTTDYISFLGKGVSRMVPKGSVLVTCIGIIGKVGILEAEEAAFNQQINAVIPNENIVKGKYLAYNLVHKRKELEHIANAPVLPIINKTQFSNLEINLPELAVQEKNIDLLDRAQSLINKRKAQIGALTSLKQSFFIEMFGNPNDNPKRWDKKQIREILEVNTGATPSRKNNSYWENGDIPWVKTTELKDKSILDVQEHITSEALKKTTTKLFPEKTILIAMYGQGKTRGKTGMLAKAAATNQACAAILPNENVNHIFLWYQLIGQYETLRNLARGGNQPNLNLSLVKKFEIILPPKELQDRFSLIIEKIEKQISLMEKSLIHLENNFEALMQRIFKVD